MRRNWTHLFRARKHTVISGQAEGRTTSPNTHIQPTLVWPYSKQYSTLVSEGNRRPPPEFGTPALIWQIGLWPRFEQGRSPEAEAARNSREDELKKNEAQEDAAIAMPGAGLEGQRDGIDLCEHTKVADKEQPEDIKREYEACLFNRDNVAFFDELNLFLTQLQERGRIKGAPLIELKHETPPELPETMKDVFAFAVGKPQSLAFTLWWQDGSGLNRRPDKPDFTAMRVRVLAQAQQDHATLSFVLDVAKPWDQDYMLDIPPGSGARRDKIMAAIKLVRRVADDQIKRGHIELDRFPERDVDAATAEALLQANDYLYDGVWREFMAAFGIEPWPDALEAQSMPSPPIGERFCESRGLVMRYDGIDTPFNQHEQADASALRAAISTQRPVPPIESSSGTTGLGHYPKFDASVGEPNAVVKAIWPFVRRMTYRADERDTVACGILGWRALFISAMGSSTSSFDRDESRGLNFDVPGGHLPPPPPMINGVQANRPTRHLFLTKGEPNRLQLGRFIDRVHAAESLRLFALKNWETIRNASLHIRVLGQELDHVLTRWGQTRAQIDADFRFGKVQRGLTRMGTDGSARGSGDDGSYRSNALRELTSERIRKMSDLIRSC